MANSSQPPKYRHYKPKNLGVVRLDGKDHYLGQHGSPESWEKYHRLVGEWMVTRRTKVAASPIALPTAVSSIILAYWEHAQSHYRALDGTLSEELGNIKVAVRPLRKLYGTTPVSEFGPLCLRAVRDEMVRSGLSRNSVNARVNRIRRMFKWAASVELVPVSVVQALATVAGLQAGRTTARETAPIGPVPIEVVHATLPSLPRPVAAMVRMQLLTGMRPGEACAMRGIDLVPGDVTWIYTPKTHKSAWRGKTREILLGPKAVELIKGLLKTDLEEYLFDPRQAVADHHQARGVSRKTIPTPSEKTKVVESPGSRHRHRYSRSSYLDAIRRACDRLHPHPTIRKIKNKPLSPEDKATLLAWRKAHRWHPNQLRHTVATIVRAKYGLEAAQVVLGHARADVTQVYAERDHARASEVIREIG